MNDYVEKNGKFATVYTQIGKNDFTSKTINNTSNIDECLASQNRIESINKRKRDAKRELNKLSYDNDISKILNRFALAAGIVLTLITKKINASGFDFIPYMMGTLVTFAPATFYNTFGKRIAYSEKHQKLENEIDNLEDACKREISINSRLNQASKKVSNYSECKEVEDRHYVEKYNDSKIVKRLRSKGYSDDMIEKHFAKVDESLKEQQKSKYDGLSFEESCKLFEDEVNGIHLTMSR